MLRVYQGEFLVSVRCVATLLEEYGQYSLFIQLCNGRDSMLLPSEEWDCHLGIFCVENNEFVFFDFGLVPNLDSLDQFSMFLLVFRLGTLGLLASEQRDTNSARRSKELPNLA